MNDKIPQLSIKEKLERLACECELLDPEEEKMMAEEGIEADIAAWTTY